MDAITVSLFYIIFYASNCLHFSRIEGRF